MLSKTFFLATVFGICLFCGSLNTNASNRATVSVEALLSHGEYLTTQRWRLKPRWVTVPTNEKIDHRNFCYQAELKSFLDHKLVGQPIKVKFIKPYRSTQLFREAEIKFDNKHDLSEFLLRQGWAQLNPVNEKLPQSYVEAENKAKQERSGLWGSCDNWFKLRQEQRRQGRTVYFPQAHKSLLASKGVSWVAAVLAPNLIELDTGQKIILQGVKVPAVKTDLATCWQTQVVSDLEALLVGKKVELEYDQLELTSNGKKLHRYVWLSGNRWQSPLLINKFVIENGWAQLDLKELKLKNVEAMQMAPQAFYRRTTPPAWWQQCAGDKIESQQVKTETSSQALVYDEQCRIKGNVAGSQKNPKKTYHTPLSGWYKRLEAEQCFKTETEALEAGFTKVK